jgi:GNAT superfamily N-acetyltransferase
MPPSGDLQIRIQGSDSGDICRNILQTLPAWFGVPESVEDYVATANRSTTVIATLDGDDVGLLTFVSHNPYAAEVYVMAVRPEHHRRGIGRELLRRAEEILASEGVEFLQVKTRGPSKPDEGYEKTRAFYFAYGFRPLEELPDLWDAENPALIMVKVVPRPRQS